MRWAWGATAWLALSLTPVQPAAMTSKARPELVETVERLGSARVMVLLREPPAGSVAAHGRRPARQVELDADAVLARLGRSSHVIHRFATVPAMALRVDATDVRRLLADPRVARVDIDGGGAAHALPPDEASVLNKVAGLQALELGGAGMKIAVVDSGVDAGHPDLRARLVGEQCFCSSTRGTGGCCPNGQASQAGAGAAADDDGHGTHVAGIVVGEGHEAPRGALPQASLVAVKVLDAEGRFCCSSDIVAALDWLAVNHADVDAVNLSLGTDAMFAGDCDAATAYTQAMARAVGNLLALGAVVSASTGNDGSTTSSQAPACIRNVIGTGATWDYAGGPTVYLDCAESSTAPRQVTCFSNRSPTTDLFAAGAYVVAARLGGGASNRGGTSMAAPMVAACGAALKQAQPFSTAAQRVEAMTLSKTRVTDPLSGRIYPFLDCEDAVRLLNPTIFQPIARHGSRPLLPPASARDGAAGTPASARGTANPPATGKPTGPGADEAPAARGDAGRTRTMDRRRADGTRSRQAH